MCSPSGVNCSASLASRVRVRAAAANGVTAAPAHAPALVALDPKKRIAFKLAEKHVLSHNVRRYRFALQSPQHKFGLPVGKHVFAYAKCAPCLHR
jgi:nitrate reductase (NAD(P)H)